MPTSREERWAKVRASKQAIDNAVPGWVPVTVTVPADMVAEAVARVSDAEIAAVPHFPAEETPAPAPLSAAEAELAAGIGAATEEAAAEPTPLDDLADLFADPPAEEPVVDDGSAS